MIDIRSDTVTKPSERMREAARNADVGDDVHRGDPTVKELESRVAELVGMEASLLVPSGTMGNQIAAMTHTKKGEEVIVESKSHIYNWEVGGLAQHSGLQVRPIDGGKRGIPKPEQIYESYSTKTLHSSGTGLLSLENTHNRKGGIAIEPKKIDGAAEAAHELGFPVHLDGARLFNAAVALDVPATRLTRNVDSVMFCLSKGLGAPVGSMLAGEEEFIERARRNRKLLGGGMRQAGIIAAPGLVSLENIDRLSKDHKNASLLAEGLNEYEGVDVQPPETNIVLIDTSESGMTASEFLDACESEGVLGSEFGDYVVRFCTHLDVDEEAIKTAVDRVGAVLS
ncbi:MAG: low specificity L-threonine aldolase [Halobacteria archaeon]|nr:low specificity L-threonine aldolase [Halobacteria archaeon]